MGKKYLFFFGSSESEAVEMEQVNPQISNK